MTKRIAICLSLLLIGRMLAVPILGNAQAATSGVNFQSFPLVIRWVVELARSNIVRELKPSQYLTVSIPRVKASEIKGIDVVSRPFIAMGVESKPFIRQDTDSKREVWEFERYTYKGVVPAESDLASYRANRIVIVLMRADENDYGCIQEFKKRISEIPAWLATPAQEKR